MDHEAPVYITPYDPAWPAMFDAERIELLRTLGEWIVGGIEHFGSTAVPGLAAKPVIDIMAGVESLTASWPAIAVAEAAGYCYAPYRPDEMHWFCKPSFAMRTHHLHLLPVTSPRWRERLLFRDYLRNHPEIAREYADLKHSLAERYRFDREAYTDAKAPFVARIVALAGR